MRRTETGRRDERPRLSVRKTYKLYIGGAFPRSESGRSYEVEDTKGRFLANAALGVPQGRPRRRRGRAQGVRRLVGRDRVQPRPGPLPGRRGARGPARPVRRRGRAPARACPRKRGRGRRRRGDRPAGSGTPGWARQDRPGRRRRPTRSPARTSTSPSPSRPAWSRSLAPQESACSAWSSVVAPAIVTGNTVRRGGQREAHRCRRSRSSEVLATSDVPGGVVNVLTGRRPRSRPGSPRTWTSTRST